MRKKKEQTPEDIARLTKESIDRQRTDLQKDVDRGFVPSPMRKFDIGQEVEFGGHEHCTVEDKTEDGMLYLIHCKYTKTDSGAFSSQVKSVDSKHWALWLDVFPKREKKDWEKIPQFTQREEMRLQFFQSSLSSFHSYVYSFGVDINPDYQRGFVWTLEDKQKLIDSIFKGVDIGKFVFIRREYDRTKNPTEHLYEILDGKQRLTAITEFLEDRFRFNGLLYSELHPHDQSHFDGYSISLAEVSNPTKKQIYQYFLRLNTGGKAMDEGQLKKVEKLLEDSK